MISAIMEDKMNKCELSEEELELLSYYNKLSEIRKIDLLGYASFSLESSKKEYEMN